MFNGSHVPNIDSTALIEGALAILGGIIWLVRLEAAVRNIKEDRIQRAEQIDGAVSRNEKRIEKLEDRHDQVYSEMRAVLLSIQKSLSKLEGKLSIGSSRDD